ncbi:hypothetical protein EIP86_000823 [Pleurotus ostreatoroseus]|nr:hypothetical protein EIP86_000823 [Pleurotus ostreatoroseus]
MDDCWHAPSRDPTTGAPVADPNKFPNGVKDLSDKIHALGLKVSATNINTGKYGVLGLKFGIYSDAGTYVKLAQMGFTTG